MPHEDDVPFSTFMSHKNDALKVVESHKSGPAKSELSRILREKEEMLASVAEKRRKGPLQLLDLPMDVLKDIIKEVWLPPQEPALSYLSNNSTGHAYQRSHVPCVDAFCSAQPCYTPHLLTV